MPSEYETPLENLYRKLVVTASARFEANRHLQLHHKLSLWTVSLFSVGIIVFQLIDILNIKTSISKPVLAAIQIISAIVIIIFSVLVNVSRFSERANHMYTCALDINALARRLLPTLPDGEANTYETIECEYEEILKRYENHSQIDYWVALLRKARDIYGLTTWNSITIHVRLLLSYIHYMILLLIQISMIYFVLK